MGKQEAVTYSLSDTLNFAPCSSFDTDNANDLFFIGKQTPQSMYVCDTHKKEYKCCILINHIDTISSHLLFHILFSRFIMNFFLSKKSSVHGRWPTTDAEHRMVSNLSPYNLSVLFFQYLV